jgi:hypothetical protein
MTLPQIALAFALAVMAFVLALHAPAAVVAAAGLGVFGWMLAEMTVAKEG